MNKLFALLGLTCMIQGSEVFGTERFSNLVIDKKDSLGFRVSDQCREKYPLRSLDIKKELSRFSELKTKIETTSVDAENPYLVACRARDLSEMGALQLWISRNFPAATQQEKREKQRHYLSGQNSLSDAIDLYESIKGTILESEVSILADYAKTLKRMEVSLQDIDNKEEKVELLKKLYEVTNNIYQKMDNNPVSSTMGLIQDTNILQSHFANLGYFNTFDSQKLLNELTHDPSLVLYSIYQCRYSLENSGSTLSSEDLYAQWENNFNKKNFN